MTRLSSWDSVIINYTGITDVFFGSWNFGMLNLVFHIVISSKVSEHALIFKVYYLLIDIDEYFSFLFFFFVAIYIYIHSIYT